MQMYVREAISGATLNLKYGTKDSLSFCFFFFIRSIASERV